MHQHTSFPGNISTVLYFFIFRFGNDQSHVIKDPDLGLLQIKLRHDNLIIVMRPWLHIPISVKQCTVCPDKKKIRGMDDLIMLNRIVIKKIPDELAINRDQGRFIFDDCAKLVMTIAVTRFKSNTRFIMSFYETNLATQ